MGTATAIAVSVRVSPMPAARLWLTPRQSRTALAQAPPFAFGVAKP
ncbi:MAG: hypothetical protein F6K28_57520 [Microcoleus sp. SIO2G3]|nr:hypothetical protein [Microcoleus sp. SIO2G3]